MKFDKKKKKHIPKKFKKSIPKPIRIRLDLNQNRTDILDLLFDPKLFYPKDSYRIGFNPNSSNLPEYPLLNSDSVFFFFFNTANQNSDSVIVVKSDSSLWKKTIRDLSLIGAPLLIAL